MNIPILITGGTQRLGLAIANDLLAKDQHVIITYRTEKPSIESLREQGAQLIHADFSSNDGIIKFISALKKTTSTLRAIIHNASDWDKETPETDFAELFDKMMLVHASAAYQINMACKDMLVNPNGFADIIHMTDYVQDVGSKKHIAYAASKAALHNLTLSFSNFLAPKVKVNSIAPALLMFNEWDSEEYKAKAMKKSLLEKVPGEIEGVKAVNYLLNSEYITGQCIHLNGGRNLK